MKELAKLIKDSTGKNVLLLTHHNADPDAVCSAIALSKILKKLNAKVRVGVVDSVSSLAKNVLNGLKEEVEINPNIDSDILILLDTATEGQLSDFAEKVKNSKAKKIIIDHHTIQEKPLESDYSLIDENASSTVELIYKLAKELDFDFDRETALAILAGMTADTAHLRFAKLDNFKIIVELMETKNIEYKEILNLLTIPPDVSEKIAVLKAANRAEVHRIKDYLIVTSYIKSFEASAARAFLRIGADLSAVVAKRDTEIRISLRAKSKFVDETGIDLGKNLIGEVAKIINGSGSGHPTAAGANGKDLNNGKDALNYIISFVKQKLEK